LVWRNCINCVAELGVEGAIKRLHPFYMQYGHALAQSWAVENCFRGEAFHRGDGRLETSKAKAMSSA